MSDGFDTLVRAFLDDPAISTGRMFGSDGLKVNGKVFAMNVKEDLVVKLPAERCLSRSDTPAARRYGRTLLCRLRRETLPSRQGVRDLRP